MADAIDVEVAEGTPDASEIKRELAAVARPHISWGAIIGGVFASLGLWLLLYVFGLAVGLSRIDPRDPGTLKSAGIFTGVWGLLAPLVALFAGGLVAGRASGVGLRGEGAVHGLVMWGLTTVVGALMVGATLSAMVTSMTAGGGVGIDLSGAPPAALQAAHDTGRAFWGVFGTLLLGLLAALAGGALGVHGRWGRRHRRVVVPLAPRVVPPPREVYP